MVFMTVVQERISIGNWSVSQPKSGDPVLASTDPSIPSLMHCNYWRIFRLNNSVRYKSIEWNVWKLLCGKDDVVLVAMSGQSGVIRFDVQLEMFVQIKLAKETDDSHGVVVVLVPGRLFRLGFDQHLTLEANLVLVICKFNMGLLQLPFITNNSRLRRPRPTQREQTTWNANYLGRLVFWLLNE